MGLLDDPLGFVFGKDDEQGAIDKRVNRDPAGQRWWDAWERMYQGQTSPESIMAQAHELMTKPVNVNINGTVVPIHRMGRAQGLMGLLDPWERGGHLLESGRMGQAYYRPGDNGLVGDMISDAGKSFSTAFGKPLGNAYSKYMPGMN